jgi:hypothetical protein
LGDVGIGLLLAQALFLKGPGHVGGRCQLVHLHLLVQLDGPPLSQGQLFPWSVGRDLTVEQIR